MNLDNLNLETLIIHGDMAFTNDNWSHELKKQIIGKSKLKCIHFSDNFN